MKKYLLGVIAIIASITFNAFTIEKDKVGADGEKWFQLKVAGDPDTAGDYSLFGDGSTAPTCSGDYVCAVLAVPNSQNTSIPNLGTIIQTKKRATQ